MTRGQRTIVTLLVIIAVLLALNMLVRGSPSAEAQMTSGPTPTVVSGEVHSSSNVRYIYRFWSDGSVDLTDVFLTLNPDNTPCRMVNQICPPLDIIPPSCPADIDRDRDVGVGDMLDVFAMWGPCPE